MINPRPSSSVRFLLRLLIALGLVSVGLLVLLSALQGNRIAHEEVAFLEHLGEIRDLEATLITAVNERNRALDRETQIHQHDDVDFANAARCEVLQDLNAEVLGLLSRLDSIAGRISAEGVSQPLVTSNDDWMSIAADLLALVGDSEVHNLRASAFVSEIQMGAEALIEEIHGFEGVIQLRQAIARRELHQRLARVEDVSGLDNDQISESGGSSRLIQMLEELESGAHTLILLAQQIRLEPEASHLVNIRDNRLAPTLQAVEGDLGDLRRISVGDLEMAARADHISTIADGLANLLLGDGWTYGQDGNGIITGAEGFYDLWLSHLQTLERMSQIRADLDSVGRDMVQALQDVVERFDAFSAEQSRRRVTSIQNVSLFLCAIGALVWIVFMFLGGVIAKAIKRMLDRMGELQGIAEETATTLQESERRLHTLMGNLPGMAYRCRFDWEWTVEFLSEGAKEITGRPASDFINNSRISFGEVIHGEDRERVYRQVEAAVAADELFQLEYRIFRPDGEVRWVWEQGQSVHLPGEERAHLEGFIMDVTGRKLAEQMRREVEEQHRNLMENLPVGVYRNTPGRDGKFVMANHAVARMFGFESVEEFLRMSVSDLYPDPQERERFSAELLREGHVAGHEMQLRRRDGTPIWVAVTARVIHSDRGEITHFDGLIEDITLRRRSEEHIRKINQLQLQALGPQDMNENLKQITDGIVQIFGADFCRIWLTAQGDRCQAGCIHAKITEGPHVCRHRDRCLHLRASSGRYTHLDGDVHRRVPFGCYKIGLVASGQNRKFLTNEAQSDPRIHNHEWARELGLSSFAGYQLCPPGGESIGVLALFSTNPITPDEAALLEGLANATALIVQKAQAEEAVRESEEKFRVISAAAHDAVIMMDSHGDITFWNAAAERVFGYTAEEAIGKSLHAILAPSRYSEAIECGLARFWKTGAGPAIGETLDLSGRRRDGSEIPVEVSLSSIQMRGEWCAVGIVRDITVRKRAEEAMRRSEEFLQSIIDGIPEPLMVINRDYTVALANRATRDCIGGRDPVSNCLKCHSVSHRRDTPCKGGDDPCPLRIVMETKRPVQLPHVHFDAEGNEIYVDVMAAPIFNEAGEVCQIIETSHNVTERKRAEEDLRQSEEQIKAILDAIQIGILVIDAASYEIVDVNPSAAMLIGADRGEIIGQRCQLFICPHEEGDCPVSDHNLSVNNTQCTLLTIDGREVDILKSVVPLMIRGRHHYLESFMDITELKRAEEQSNRLATAIDQASEGILITNDMGEIQYVNPAFEQITGHQSADVIGQTPRILKSGKHDAAFYADLWETIKRGDKWHGHLTNMRKDGTLYEEEATISPIRDEDGKITNFVSVKRDVSEQMTMEAQLRQAQRLESIGQLAAGIAHEINTPTQYVGDNARFLKDAFADLNPILESLAGLIEAAESGELLPERLSEIKQAIVDADLEYMSEEIPRAIDQSLEGIDRVAKIVLAMKEFSHPGESEKLAFDINRGITSTTTVARNVWKYVADLDLDLDPDLPLVPCLPGEFNQVILNIVVNAAHAIADVVNNGSNGRGKITVSTRHDGSWAEIRITDTGTGIPEEHRDRIFEHFFTTKDVGKGTGQGLALAHSVVTKKHGGEITFESQMGKGTTFIIRLPIESNAPVRGVPA